MQERKKLRTEFIICSLIVSFDILYEDFLMPTLYNIGSITFQMHGSSHIRSVLIGVKYQNCLQTLSIYLCFAIWIGQIQSKLLNGLVPNGLDGM